MPAALIIEQQIPLQFVALGASNSHFNYSPGQSMTELGRGERIQWGCLIKKKEKKKESTKSPDTVIEDMNLSALAGSKPVRLACSDGNDNGWKESLKLLGGNGEREFRTAALH